MALEQAGVPSVAVHTHVFARLAQSVARANGMPRTRQAYVPQPIVDHLARATARLHRGHRSGLAPAVHAGGDRGADAAARRGRSQGPVVRALDAAAARARHRRQSPAAVHREQLDRLPAGHPADRGTRRRHAQGHEPSARQGGRPAAPDRVPRILGAHRREGRGQRRDGRRQAGISAGDPGARARAASPRARAARRRWR